MNTALSHSSNNTLLDHTSTTLDDSILADQKAGVINIWNLNSKALFYLHELFPLVMTLSIAFLGLLTLKFFWKRIQLKLKSIFWCSITISKRDDTFVWMQKYMQDKGIIKHDTILNAGLKKPKEDDDDEQDDGLI